MADITALEVIDTAIKIGLGAAIAGISAIFVARHNHRNDLQKMQFSRRLDSIERTSDVANKHFATWAWYSGTIAAAYDTLATPSSPFGKEEWKSINASDNEFMQSMRAFQEAAARLSLLGESDAYRRIMNYVELVAVFRNTMIVEGKTPTFEQYTSVTKDVGRCRKSIYESLSTSYAKVPQ